MRSWLRRPDVLMVVTSAPTYVATREALKGLSAPDLTTVRFLAGAAILGLYLLITRQRLRLTRRDVPRVLVIALFGYAGFGLLLNLGQTTVPAGTTSLLLNISPIFAFMLGYFVLAERTTKFGYLGMLIAVVGVLAITFGDTSAVGFDKNALLIVAAALLLSLFLIIQQPLFARIPPVEVVFWGCAIGGVMTLPATSFDIDTSRFTGTFWLAIVVLVFISTALGYAFWNVALARTSVAEGSSLLLVVPVFSLLLGWLLLGEVPTVASLLGGAITLSGVIMLSRAMANSNRAGRRSGSPAILPLVQEDIAEIGMTTELAVSLEEIAVEARGAVGGKLVTISLWRPQYPDLVRVYSSTPEIYRVGGISRNLGKGWVRQCVIAQRSFLAEDGSGINSDAFEHQDVLNSLNLAAAVNIVISGEGEFLGCLNLLDVAGAYSESSVALAESYAARLAPILRQVQTI